VAKKEHREIVEKIELFYDNDLYKIGDFFVKLYTFNKRDNRYTDKRYNNIKNIRNDTNRKLEYILSENEFLALINSFPFKLKQNIMFNGEEKILTDHIGHKRNNLAHANSSTVSFDDIYQDIDFLIKEFEDRCIKELNL